MGDWFGAGCQQRGSVITAHVSKLIEEVSQQMILRSTNMCCHKQREYLTMLHVSADLETTQHEAKKRTSLGF